MVTASSPPCASALASEATGTKGPVGPEFDMDNMSDWMKVMLEGIERKRLEAEAAREEQAARRQERTPPPAGERDAGSGD